MKYDRIRAFNRAGDTNLMGTVKDPFGHTWAIASQKWILTPEEIAKNQEEWLKSMASDKNSSGGAPI